MSDHSLLSLMWKDDPRSAGPRAAAGPNDEATSPGYGLSAIKPTPRSSGKVNGVGYSDAVRVA